MNFSKEIVLNKSNQIKGYKGIHEPQPCRKFKKKVKANLRKNMNLYLLKTCYDETCR